MVIKVWLESTKMSDGLKEYGKSKSGNFWVMGTADGPQGQNALLIGCKVHMDEAKDELYDFLRKVKKLASKEFTGFVFKKAF